MGKFHAAVASWAQRAIENNLEVARGAMRELVEIVRTPVGAGGAMPVDTSYLQESLDASLTSMPKVNPAFDGGTPMTGLSLKVEAMISNLKAGQKIYFGFVATYAARQNYGFVGTDSLGRTYNQGGHHFVELATQRWPELVRKHRDMRMQGGDAGV